MERHRNDHVETLLRRNGPGQQPAKRIGQGPYLSILEEVNQLAQCLFIRSEGVDGIEASKTQPAHGAPPLFIQRKTIQEGSLAVLAEIISRNRPGRMETIGAYGNSGNFAEGLAANPAIVWEKKLKKAAESPFCERQNRAAEIGQQGT